MGSLKSILSKRLVLATPAFIASLLLHIAVTQKIEASGYGMMISNCLLVMGAIILVSGFISYYLDKNSSKQEGS